MHATPRPSRWPLRLACSTGQSECVKDFLHHGADPNEANSDGWTPLLSACENGNWLCVSLLLHHGADPGLADAEGVTPLIVACTNGHEQCAQLLLDRDADIVTRLSPEGRTPLTCASAGGYVLCAKAVLDGAFGIGPNHADKRGGTPLNEACMRGHLECAKFLLDRGADPNQADGAGRLPLGVACTNGHLECAKLLLDRGASTDQGTDMRRCTPLIVVCFAGKRAFAELLLDYGADPNQAHAEGNTPLSEACRRGHSACAKLLLDCGADPNGSRRCTPLVVSCFASGTAVVKLLLDHGADPNQADANGNTPLGEACRGGSVACAKLLLDCGADPNLRCGRGLPGNRAAELVLDHVSGPNQADANGNTPLGEACGRGYAACTELLLDCRADPNLGCGRGLPGSCIPLILAAERYGECALLLAKYGASIGPALLRNSRWPWLRRAARAGPTRLHRLDLQTPEEVEALLCEGADPNDAHGYALSPADVARKLTHDANHCAKAHTVLAVAKGWAPVTHGSFPRAARKRAAELLAVGVLLTSNDGIFSTHGGAMREVWIQEVIPRAILPLPATTRGQRMNCN